MIPGVSTSCFYPQVTEEAFEYLAVNNVKAMEVFVNCEYETSPKFLKPLKKMADEYGIHIVSLHPYTSGEEGRMFFGLYERRLQESREFYKKYYEACKILDAEALVFHGDRFAGLSWEAYIERFAMVHGDAEKYDVKLCLENVYQFRSGHPEIFETTRKLVPDAQFVLDTKQAVLSGYHPDDYVKAMGVENIHHIHISDHDVSRNEACLLPGTGTFKMQKFVNSLEQKGYKGALLLELYRWNYENHEELIEGYGYIDNLISPKNA